MPIKPLAAKLRSNPVFEILNARIFETARYSAAHEIPRVGIFRSAAARWLLGLWLRFFAPGGRAFLGATVAFFLYALASLEVSSFVPLLYAVLVWPLAWLARFLARPSLQIAVTHPPRVAAGESFTVEAQLLASRRTFGGHGALLPHRLPAEIEVQPPSGAPLPPIRRNDSATVHLQLRPDKRGIYGLQGWRLESDLPFGLLVSAQTHLMPSKLIVYPRFEPLERIELPPTLKYQPGGVAFAAARGETVEYIGNREYREGDEVRHIDWRATARLNTPVVREYREEYFLRAAIVLDTHLPRPTPEACADFERAISLCAACSDAMNRADYLIDILAAGPNLYHLLAGRGLASLDQILDILAALDSTKESPWAALSPALEANLEQLSSIVCLFLEWDEERRAFATGLLESGVAVKIVVLRDEPTRGRPQLDPLDSWPGEITVLGAREWQNGVKVV